MAKGHPEDSPINQRPSPRSCWPREQTPLTHWRLYGRQTRPALALPHRNRPPPAFEKTAGRPLCLRSTSGLEAAGESRPHPPVHVPVGGERLSAHGALVGPLPGVHQHVAVQGAGRAQRLPADAARVVGPASVRVVLRKARITASLRRAGLNSATGRCEFRALYIHACINTHTHLHALKSQQCFSAIFLLLFHFKCLPKCQNLSGPQTNKHFVRSSLSVSQY